MIDSIMRGGFLYQIDSFARGLLPLLTAVSVIILASVPTRLPLLPMVGPALVLAVVYYWTIYRPDLMNVVYVAFLGLFQDLLSGGHPGVTSFILLVAYVTVVTQRRFFHGKTFSVVWWGFMLIAMGASVLTWGVSAILAGAWIDPRAAGIGLLLTILLYPPVAAVLSQAHRAVPARDMDV